VEGEESYLFSTIWHTYMKFVTKYQIPVINSCFEKCAYMFNVYKNQQSWQTGSRNLMGPKTLPTIWGTYMTLVTKYPSIQDIFRHIFSQPLDGRNLIFGHKLHIGIPYRGKRFWPHQIPTSCLPTLLVSVHLAEGFQRTRLKCEGFQRTRLKCEVNGRQVMAKAHNAFGKVS
jgi:hypothetical protein